jgi:hypothetical protein
MGVLRGQTGILRQPIDSRLLDALLFGAWY